MGLVGGFIKYKAIKNGIQVVRNVLKRKNKTDSAVKPYKTTATY